MRKLCTSQFYQLCQISQTTKPIAKQSILFSQSDHIYCDLQLLQTNHAKIQGLVIVNNILNQQWLEKALNCCQNIVLADGGANRFYETPFKDNPKIRYIVGDLDSLKPNVRQFYENKGIKFEKVWNQDTNDFEKAFNKSIEMGWKKMFCFGAFGGRMDHTLSSMHHSTKLCKKYSDLQIVLFGQTNMMYFIRPNIPHVIKISKKFQKTGCGLIPFGKAQKVKTKGFRWDIGPGLMHSSLQWGDYISTSNQIQGDTLQVESSDPIFFVAHFN